MAGLIWNSGTVAILLMALATLALAIFILAVNFTSRVHRALALFLVLRGLLDGLLAFTSQADDLGYRLRVYLFIAVPFAAVHFAMVYRRRHLHRHGPTALPWFGPLLLLAASAFEGLYLLDHGWFGQTVDGLFEANLLAIFTFLPYPAYAGISAALAHDARREAGREHRRALVAASAGFALQPLFYVWFRLNDLGLDLVRGEDDLFPAAFQVAESVAYAVAIGFLLFTARNLHRALTKPDELPLRRRMDAAFLVCVASGTTMAVVFAAVGTPPPIEAFRVVLSIWALALPLLVSYAVLRYRLFDVDVKLRFAVRGTTLAGIFVAVFFIVNKVTENVVAAKFQDGNAGIYVGGVVAGLLLFALAPLQKLAERVAKRAVPESGAAHATHDERKQIYREQLEIAWGDGALTAKESLLFSKLQERLGITAQEAATLEREVLVRLRPPPTGPKAKRAAV